MPGASDRQAAREQVARASRRLAGAGLVIGTAGNVSVVVDDEVVAITPTGAALADLDPADVAIVDRAGAHVDGPLAATSELDLHLRTYARHGAGAVVHTHAPMATALACVVDELPVVHYALLALGGPVRVAPYRTFGTPELAEVTVAALEGRTAALMANHGAITTGHDLDAAVAAAELLEWGSALYRRAAQLGTPRVLDEADREAVSAAVAARGYGRPHAAGESEPCAT